MRDVMLSMAHGFMYNSTWVVLTATCSLKNWYHVLIQGGVTVRCHTYVPWDEGKGTHRTWSAYFQWQEQSLFDAGVTGCFGHIPLSNCNSTCFYASCQESSSSHRNVCRSSQCCQTFLHWLSDTDVSPDSSTCGVQICILLITVICYQRSLIISYGSSCTTPKATAVTFKSGIKPFIVKAVISSAD